MKFEFQGKTFRIKFKYGRQRSPRNNRRSTTAIVEWLKDENPAHNEVLLAAKVRCDNRDQFVKATGRRKALVKALGAFDAMSEDVLMNLSRVLCPGQWVSKEMARAFRIKVWDTYFDHISKKEYESCPDNNVDSHMPRPSLTA